MTAVLELVRSNHGMAEDSHKRLRETVRDLKMQIETQDDELSKLQRRLATIEQTPINVEKVTFSAWQMVSIVVAAIGIVGSIWTLKVGVDNVASTVTATAKLQDERYETQKQAMDQLRANLEMRRVEIQNLSNFVQQQLPGAKR